MGVLGAGNAAVVAPGVPDLAIFQPSVLTLKLLNLLQHGLIRSNRACPRNDLSKLLGQLFDGVP